MSIRVVCPNGHALVVKDSFAGKTGLCPKCKARVQVPRLPAEGLSEDAIMGILEPRRIQLAAQAQVDDEPAPVEPERVGASPERDKSGPPKKSCHKCNREISAGIHICPFCHTYIAGLGDF